MTDAGSDPRLDDAELTALLADPAAWAEPDETLGERVAAAVAAAAGSPPLAASAPARRRRARWLPTVAAALGGAAAAALIAVVAWPQTAEAPTAEGEPIEMIGTELAPQADGTASIRERQSGWAIEMSIPDLPRLGGGEFYQVWVADCDREFSVPAGSFFDLRQAVAWAGVSMDEFPRVSVTREALAPAADAGQATSGEVLSTGVYGTCP